MPDTCIKRRLLFACRQTYAVNPPAPGGRVGWTAAPQFITAGPGDIDRALVGRIDQGIVVAFRGTLAPVLDGQFPIESIAGDWANNLAFTSNLDPTYPGRVHRGFAKSIERLWPRVSQQIASLMVPGGPNRLFITGHSKGGALAVLASWRALALAGLAMPIRVVTIAAARAGNADFRTAFQLHGAIRCTRYENVLDAVPLVPAGVETPLWARPLVARVFPQAGELAYFGVGERVPRQDSLEDAFRAFDYYFHGFGLDKLRGEYLPLLAAAHSIDPGSAYDQLVCDGEPGCNHA